MFLFLTNALSFFWSLGLKNAFMSYFPKIKSEEKPVFLSSVFVLFLGLGFLTWIMLYIFESLGILSIDTNLYYLGLFLVFSITASLAEHILLVYNRPKSIFFYGFISYTFYIVILGVTGYLTMNINKVLLALLIWAIGRFLYVLYLVVRYGAKRIDLRLLKTFLYFGMPLIIHVLLGGGMEYVDGFLVDHFFSKSDFAVFRYGVRELPINTIFISALASASIPLAVQNIGSTMVHIKERLSKMMNWLFPLSALIMVFSPWLFENVYSSEFRFSAHLFNVYLLILCSRILLPQVVLYANHKNNVLMWTALIELVLNVALSLVLLNYYGMLGIAYATVVAYFVQKIILVTYVKTKLSITLNDYIDVRKYLGYSISLYLVFILVSIYIN